MTFLQHHLGEVAALGTATCWVFTSLAFAAASRLIGPTAVNVLRILVAACLLTIIHRLTIGRWIPAVDRTGVLLLAGSGVVGFALSDQCLFRAFVDIGPRLASLLMTLVPPVAAGLAWLTLGEPLGLTAGAGILVTLLGIAWVALERPDPTARQPHPHRTRGVICGVIAAASQAAGLILAKLGIGHSRLPVEMHLDPWSASLTRVAFGATAICLIAALRKAASAKPAFNAPVNADSPPLGRRPLVPRALLLLTIGAILGPVIGVWLSLVAVDRSHAGVAATLMAMTPVFILPFAAWIEKERLSWRAITGAAIAVAGVAILTLADSSGAVSPR